MSRSGRTRPRWTLAAYDIALDCLVLRRRDLDPGDTTEREHIDAAYAVLSHDRELLVRRKARRDRDLARANLPVLPAVGDVVEVRLAGRQGWHRGTVSESNDHHDKLRVDVEVTGKSHHYGRGSLDWVRAVRS